MCFGHQRISSASCDIACYNIITGIAGIYRIRAAFYFKSVSSQIINEIFSACRLQNRAVKTMLTVDRLIGTAVHNR